MTSWRYILASLVHHRRVHLAVAAGVAVATAVITGALLVGDSVRGSLRELSLERLGRIEAVLVAVQPFRTALADEFELRAEQAALPLKVVPLTIARGTLKTTGAEQRIATGLTVFGCGDGFWDFGNDDIQAKLGRREIGLTAALAAELGAQPGDSLLLRLPATSALPGDSTLAEKEDTIVSRRFKVAAVLPNKSLARFSLQPTQRTPRNVFLSLRALQDLLDWQDQANALAVAQPVESATASQEFWDQLSAVPLEPSLNDLGLQLQQVASADKSESPALQLTSRAMVLPEHAVEVVQKLFAKQQPQRIVTYLANTIEIEGRKIPYSTITGVKSTAMLGPLVDTDGKPIEIAAGEIVLNAWAAEDLQAEVGDRVVVTYYEPETTHGKLREVPPQELTLKAIVPLVDSEGQPTRAADPALTPELPGVTDQRSIADWDLPFELVEEIRAQDEVYWEEHRTTPKAFVALETAERLWHTRWGTTSAVRLPSGDLDEIAQQLATKLNPEELSMSWLPVRLAGLKAAQGTTAFEGLFLGFSLFLLVSAVLLVSLLFKLGVEGRTTEIGVLAAVGYSAAKLRRLLLAEAALVAVIGATVGVAAGVAYARLMIYGLSTWWVAATVEPFLSLHVTPTSLLLGFAIGLAVALATTAWALRKIVRLPVRQMLAGDCGEADEAHRSVRPSLHWLPHLLVAAAALAAFLGKDLSGEAQAGAFFGAGALVLTSLLWHFRQRLRTDARSLPQTMSLTGLASRNAHRNPSRSILSVSLAAVASFLIVALGAFRLTPSEQGTGGFDLVATSDQPILLDLNTDAGRTELGFDAADNAALAGIDILALRVHAGEDASCLNLYQTTQPQIVSVPDSLSNISSFAWANVAKDVDGETPWQVLHLEPGVDDVGRPIVPIVLDKNTATYSLHLTGIGTRMTIRDELNRQVTLELAGLLAGSVLQGNVLMSEANFLRLFPSTTGHRMFLVRAGQRPATRVAELLESKLEDFGFQATNANQRLADFMAVQNTYLSTFQSLGALGLLLGTVGLAIAQLRSVLERRSELAVLRSAGFRRGRVAMMVLGENLVLLLCGLGIGCLAALVAVLPHWLLGAADLPWATLAAMLLSVVAASTLAGILAVRAAVQAPLVTALRGE